MAKEKLPCRSSMPVREGHESECVGVRVCVPCFRKLGETVLKNFGTRLLFRDFRMRMTTEVNAQVISHFGSGS